MDTIIISSDPWISVIEGIANPYLRVLVQIFLASFLILIAYMLSKLISTRITKFMLMKEGISYETKNLVTSFFFYICFVALFTLVFRAVGFNLIAITGGLIFAICFASEEIFRNMIAGIMILTTKEVCVGDLIQIDYKKQELFGRVEEITLRYTVLRANADIRRYIIPNHILTKYLVKTYSNEKLIRYDMSFEVERHIPRTQLEHQVITAIHSIPRIQEHEHTKLTLEQVSTNGQLCRLYCYANPKCGIPRPMIYTELYKVVMTSFQQSGNNILGYPHQSTTLDHHDKNLLESLLGLFQKYFVIVN